LAFCPTLGYIDPDMDLITRTDELAAACKRLAQASFVALDTEFMREQTFWPKLCLIQMAADGTEVLIDSLSPELDLAPFFELMMNERVLKVFHSARQDIEIVHHLAGVVPHPIFDTQVAAMVCGFGEAVSYSMLAKRLLNRNLDKSSRFTDWSRRPLLERQLTYALGDVVHLRDLYPKLKDQLDRSERESWLNEEMAVLTDPTTYQLHPEQAWRRLKMRVKTPKALALLMELAAWREREAQSQDVPRSRILKDEALYDIASQAPRTAEDLGSLRTLHNGFARSSRGRAVLETVARGLQRDMKTVPPIERGEPMPPEAQAVVDLLRVLLKATAGRHGVAPKLIATSDELEAIARSDDADVPVLRGWRRKLFGDDALALKRGELALAISQGEVAVLPADPARGRG
jgi:ribonuclease D